jgi:lysylphosphatidylglycerol synthase-like protein
VNSEPQAKTPVLRPRRISPKQLNRLKAAAALLTVAGIGLFVYLVYSVGLQEVLRGSRRLGLAGFAVLLFIYFLRMCTRAWAWSLSVYEPYSLTLKETIPAVIIGEAMSSLIPLGILISGTSKAVAVRKRVPLVVGLSSVATENLFYSLVTSVFLVLGAITFLRTVSLDDDWIWTIDVLIVAVVLLVMLGLIMVVRQWHILSECCERLYRRGFARGILEHGRLEARLFENLIYGFYRRYPRRFLPICLLEAAYHALGILEVWYVLTKIMPIVPGFLTAFLLESVSRMITIVFKLIPFVIGVDEAGARFITRSLAIGAGIGVTLAVVRKVRILFWTAVGLLLVLKRGLSLRDVRNPEQE